MPYKPKIGERVKVGPGSQFSGMIGTRVPQPATEAPRPYWIRFFDDGSVFWFGARELEAAPSKKSKKRKAK